MSTYNTEFLYTVQPGGTLQYTVNGQIANGQASFELGPDNVVHVNDSGTVTFANHPELTGTYTYLGYEPGLPGAVVQGPGNTYYLMSNGEVPLNQNFNIQQIDLTLCFLAGTLIATPAGPMAVERLGAGDMVLTADGRGVKVKWVGRQTVAVLFGIPEGRRPVVISAGALADDMPARDLRLTADHALLLDGVLVQAGALVNGSTIRRIPIDELGARFVVFHVETENHEIILAEGAPAETFVDSVSRRRFDNYAEYEAMFGQESGSMNELPQPRAMSARQVPMSIRSRIARRAAASARRTVRVA
jgi:hypothetical protein